MKRQIDRRTILLTAGAAAVAAASATSAGESSDMRGAVRFEGGAVIPEGHIEIYIEDPAVQDDARRRASERRIESDGKSRTIAFTLSAPASLAASPTPEIVARLERADGWLIARGSAEYEPGSLIDITLYKAVY